MANCPSRAQSIKDSGNRREFETGAVRDIQEGKGRCDLMPLDILAYILKSAELNEIQLFCESSNVENLKNAVTLFAYGAWPMGVVDTNQRNANLFLEASKHFEAGALKYGENNWQKGIPTHCYIDSAIRHYLKWLRGDKDEPHDRAFVWNLLCCIWTCEHKPELNDYGKVGD